MSSQEYTITRHAASGEAGASDEYHAHVEGSDKVGRLTGVRRDGNWVAEHTLVPKEIGGRGVAAALVKALVSDAREHGFKIVPQCSYVEAKFDENPEWADLRV